MLLLVLLLLMLLLMMLLLMMLLLKAGLERVQGRHLLLGERTINHHGRRV